MKKSIVVYDETNGDIFGGWTVFKNELGEIRATRQSPISSVCTPWINDKNKIRKSLPKKIKAIIEKNLEEKK